MLKNTTCGVLKMKFYFNNPSVAYSLQVCKVSTFDIVLLFSFQKFIFFEVYFFLKTKAELIFIISI